MSMLMKLLRRSLFLQSKLEKDFVICYFRQELFRKLTAVLHTQYVVSFLKREKHFWTFQLNSFCPFCSLIHAFIGSRSKLGIQPQSNGSDPRNFGVLALNLEQRHPAPPSPPSVHHVRAQGHESPSGFDLVSIIYQSSGEAERHMRPQPPVRHAVYQHSVSSLPPNQDPVMELFPHVN